MIRTFGVHRPRIDPTAFVHDSAEIIGRVTLGRSASVWPLAVLRGDVDAIRVGPRSNIQDLAVIHCRDGRPAVIGAGVTVGHGVILHGCRIGDSCLIGMGAVVMEAVIGAGSLVAAGALVLKGMRIAPRSLVLGSPAKAVRLLTAREFAGIEKSARDYLAYAKAHARNSKVLFPIPRA